MRATQHRSNNRVLGAPAGISQDELRCSAIAITDCTHAGVRAVASFWRPSSEELAMLNAGALVALIVPGSTMMPAAIEVME